MSTREPIYKNGLKLKLVNTKALKTSTGQTIFTAITSAVGLTSASVQKKTNTEILMKI